MRFAWPPGVLIECWTRKKEGKRGAEAGKVPVWLGRVKKEMNGCGVTVGGENDFEPLGEEKKTEVRFAATS